jgi:hypothetical protein
VTGIPVGRTADALFFLQAARIDARRSPEEVRQNKQHELGRYVVHYEDGKRSEIAILAEIDVDDYRQKAPAAVPGAQVAWTRPYEGSDLSAVAYCKQWNNPYPETAIKSIDFVHGTQKRGVPALIAVTVASAAR